MCASVHTRPGQQSPLPPQELPRMRHVPVGGRQVELPVLSGSHSPLQH